MRASFQNWILPSLLRRAATLSSARYLLDKRVRLRTRLGIEVDVRVRDMGGPIDVFALGAYDYSAIDWSRLEYVIDAGAHVGSLSLMVASRSNCRVLALEPNRATYRLLERNVAMAGLEARVHCLNVALGSSAGERWLSSTKLSPASTIVPGVAGDGGHPVHCLTLSDAFAASGFPRVDLLKIDIEGSEYEVFGELDPGQLRDVAAVVLECHPLSGHSVQEVVLKLHRTGFQVASEPQPGCTMLLAIR
ncbi:MAG TPA: FkbM family methyltransferase [Candidatus Acidoferrales bacterium]|nr:FkbM family methyltransferase [Candidatus Acidoferrales bacterium]